MLTDLTIGDVCQLLNCKPDHVRRLIESGELEATNIGLGSRRQWRISPGAIDRFKDARKSHAEPPRISQRRRKRHRKFVAVN